MLFRAEFRVKFWEEILSLMKYKRLTAHEFEKLKRRKKVKKTFGKTVKSTIKWLGVSFSILIVLMIGIIFFYKTIDGKKSEVTQNVGEIVSVSGLGSQTEYESEELKLNFDRENVTPQDNTKKEDNKDGTKNDKIKKNGTKKNEVKSNEIKEKKFYKFAKWNGKAPRELIVINNENPLSSNFEPNIKLCRGKQVEALVADDLEEMISDARGDGIILWISSGYRSKELQEKLFRAQVLKQKDKAKVSDEDAEALAQKSVAKPDSSEHGTGLAIDLNGVRHDFYITKEYEWLTENAYKYGFIERYRKKDQEYTGVIYEPWHFRYVGKEFAPKIKESDLCLEKYIEYFIKMGYSVK